MAKLINGKLIGRPTAEVVDARKTQEARERRALEDWLATPSGFCEGLATWGEEPLIFDDWQREFVDFNGRFYIANKSRRAGFSFACAARGESRCYLSPPKSYLAAFVSYNLADAREKIRYVDMLDESLPAKSRMKRSTSTKTEIEFANGNRIVTMFMPRGLGGDVMLDELAHITDSGLVFQAAVPMISRGGAILAGSSPLGKMGIFHDIWTGAEGKFGQFKRVEIPWWHVRALCADLERARVEAPGLTTQERVEIFGAPAMQEIFANYFLEDFQQEYECAWADESTAALPWDLIERCSPTDSPPIQLSGIGELALLRGELYVGMDVGRRINATEFSIGERLGNGKVEERLRLTYQNRPLPEQEELAIRLLQLSNVRAFVVDYTGLGLHIGDSLAQRFGSRVKLVAMSSVTKPQVFNNARAMMERDLFAFYPEREVRRQFHSIKKVITGGGNVIYDVDRNEKHHADKFWASALMLWGAGGAGGAGRPCIAVMNSRNDY
jgi:phage FluMu gp28-like protein